MEVQFEIEQRRAQQELMHKAQFDAAQARRAEQAATGEKPRTVAEYQAAYG